MHWAFHCKSHSTSIEMSLVAHGLRRTGREIVHYATFETRASRVVVYRSRNNVLSRRRVTADWGRAAAGGAGSAHLARGAVGPERWRCAAHLPATCPALPALRSARTAAHPTRKYTENSPCTVREHVPLCKNFGDEYTAMQFFFKFILRCHVSSKPFIIIIIQYLGNCFYLPSYVKADSYGLLRW